MPITETKERFDGAFDAITCPVCGSDQWTHIVFQGIFCKECNTKCTLRSPSGDQGFIATFDGTYTWATEGAKSIPESKEHGPIATGKWLGTSSTGYERYWFSPVAEHEEGDNDEWIPAWKRSKNREQPP